MAIDPLQTKIQRPAEQRLPPGRLAGYLRQHAAADHLEDARHGRQDGRAHRQHVGRQMLDAAAIYDFGADTWQEEQSDRVFVAVRDRQVRQIHLILQSQRPQQLGRAAAVGQDRSVRQHHALGRAAGTGGVDQTGERVGGDGRGFQRDVVGRRRVGDQCGPVHQPRRAGRVVRRPVDHHQQVEPTRQSPCRAQRAGEGRGGNDRRPCARVTQDVRVIGHCVGCVGRYRHRAQSHQGGFGDRVFRSVLRHDQHAVACRHTGRAQMPGAGRRHAAELLPCGLVPRAVAEAAEQGLVRPGAGEREHHGGQVWPDRILLHTTSRRPFCAGHNPLTYAPTTLHG